MNKVLKDLYDSFYTPPEFSAQKQEIEDCHQALIKALEKLERRLVLTIIDGKDRIAAELSEDSFISGFKLAWALANELNHYQKDRPSNADEQSRCGCPFCIKGGRYMK